jgi:serine/threonine protein kinase
VKLANTLLALAPGQLPLVKLCDFGYSKDTMRHSAPASQARAAGAFWGVDGRRASRGGAAACPGARPAAEGGQGSAARCATVRPRRVNTHASTHAHANTRTHVRTHAHAHRQVGTALFVAPEVMHNFSSQPYDGAKADVWSCGIVLFILLFGRHPFLRPEDTSMPEQQQMLALFTRTSREELTLSQYEAGAITPACGNLLAHVLQTRPERRCGGDASHRVDAGAAAAAPAGGLSQGFSLVFGLQTLTTPTMCTRTRTGATSLRTHPAHARTMRTPQPCPLSLAPGPLPGWRGRFLPLPKPTENPAPDRPPPPGTTWPRSLRTPGSGRACPRARAT